MRLRLGITFHSVFYAPAYVALHRGLFADEGLEVVTQTPGDGRVIQRGLERGELDAGVGGIMRSLVAYDRGEAAVPLHFARINDRDGFFLLGRTPTFAWADLLGRRLILFAEAPTPWYVLRALLREQGLDPDTIDAIDGVPADQAAGRFRAGEADFLQAPAHVAEELVRDAAAVIVREMAREAGPLPYSSYCAMPDALERAPELFLALARAHVRALHWMQSAGAAAVWQAIRPAFPDGDPEILRRAVERYDRLGLWASDASLPRESFDRLAAALHRGGLLQRIAPYEAVCRDEVTRAAMQVLRG
jgi:NitT/TauT family transport system substrate-binding protein